MSTNEWKFYIDNEFQGAWANTVNQVASIDIFPVNPAAMGGNDQCSFYVDNVSYTVTEYTLPALNGAVVLINPINGLAGQDREVHAKMRNLGTTTITSYDLTLDYGDMQISEEISDVSIESLATDDFTFGAPITLAQVLANCTVTISNVNGEGNDDDINDDVKAIPIDPVIPAPGKIVFGEEATGTWCSWCVRGHVFMEFMHDNYHGYWAGVAVHNGDPMVDVDYDAGIGSLIGGYPSALVERGADIDPNALGAAFLNSIIIPPTGVITNGANYNETTGELNISASIEWKTDVTGNWKIACVIIEDSVTGTEAGYNQANAYAGGSNGPMGGYEDLPNPVPAADMVYENVGRKILPSFDGVVIPFTDGSVNGDTKVVKFTTTIDPTWDANNISIATILIKESDGTVDNAGLATLQEAIDNGYVGINPKKSVAVNSVKLYPNPTTNTTSLFINNLDGNSVNVTVYSISGQVVDAINYGAQYGSNSFPINTKEYSKGLQISIEINEN